MTRMTTDEKQNFLADVHVGVLGLNEPGHGPLTVPVWYDYEPGGDVWFLTGPDSRKGRLIEPGSRVSLCAQTETAPYVYVSVEGPVVGLERPDTEQHSRPMAQRYLGEEMGNAYTDSSSTESILVRVRPERWLAVDYSKS